MIHQDFWVTPGGIVENSSSEHARTAKAVMLGLAADGPVADPFGKQAVTAAEVRAAKQRGADPAAVRFLQQGGDPRLWAMQQWGWIRTAKNNINVWELNEQALDLLYQWAKELKLDPHETFELNELSTNSLFPVTAKQLRTRGMTAERLRAYGEGVGRWRNPGDTATVERPQNNALDSLPDFYALALSASTAFERPDIGEWLTRRMLDNEIHCDGADYEPVHITAKEVSILLKARTSSGRKCALFTFSKKAFAKPELEFMPKRQPVQILSDMFDDIVEHIATGKASADWQNKDIEEMFLETRGVKLTEDEPDQYENAAAAFMVDRELDPMQFMTELTRLANTLRKNFPSDDYEYLGSGSFGTVFSYGPKQIIKITMDPEDIASAAIVRDNPNPLLVTIHHAGVTKVVTKWSVDKLAYDSEKRDTPIGIIIADKIEFGVNDLPPTRRIAMEAAIGEIHVLIGAIKGKYALHANKLVYVKATEARARLKKAQEILINQLHELRLFRENTLAGYIAKILEALQYRGIFTVDVHDENFRWRDPDSHPILVDFGAGAMKPAVRKKLSMQDYAENPGGNEMPTPQVAGAWPMVAISQGAVLEEFDE
jgi:hypothetical protein